MNIHQEAGSHVCIEESSRNQGWRKQEAEEKDFASAYIPAAELEIPCLCLVFLCSLFLHGLMDFLSLSLE